MRANHGVRVTRLFSSSDGRLATNSSARTVNGVRRQQAENSSVRAPPASLRDRKRRPQARSLLRAVPIVRRRESPLRVISIKKGNASMASSAEKREGPSTRLPSPTGGPFEVGYYAPTDEFRSITEHMAVMRPDGRLIALVGPATDPQSLVDAHMFKATPALYAACLLASQLLGGAYPALEQMMEEALALATVPAEPDALIEESRSVPGSHGRYLYVPGGEMISRSTASNSEEFEPVESFSEDAGEELIHVVRPRRLDGKLFEYLDWASSKTAYEVCAVNDPNQDQTAS